jgi:pimeloyl-ACP methyl ester carboxylesterase
MVAFPQRRGRGKSDGLYDEGFMPDRSRYSGDRNQCFLGVERAVSDIAAAIDVLRKRQHVQSGPLIGGQSRGGILSIAYAGKHPQQIKGVINFVGGWTGGWRSSAAEVNATLFQQGGNFPAPTLWLYGDNDPVYPLTHSKENFRAFQAAEGKERFVELREVPELNGHRVYWPQLWKAPVEEYLTTIDTKR